MTDTAHSDIRLPTHRTGVLLVLAAVAAGVMLASHPGEPASRALADVLRAEASQAAMDALVHGGFILVLALQVAGLAVLGLAIGRGKPMAVVAFCLGLFGAGMLSASMVADGFMTPAIAGHYLSAPAAAQDEARAALALLGAAVGALMPLGLAFQGLSAMAWAPVLIGARGRAHPGGVAGLIAGHIMVFTAVVSLARHDGTSLIAGLLALIVWILAAGLTLAVWRAPTTAATPSA